MYSSLLLPVIFVLAVTVSLTQALQISFYKQQQQQLPIVEPSTAINNRMLLKDTVQSHYESIVDDILSEHNEDLLTRLSTIIKDPHEIVTILKPEAKSILTTYTDISDVCVAQMPGMIANHIHELTNEIYSSIEDTVSNHWKRSDVEYRKLVLDAVTSYNHKNDEQYVLNELMATLENINMEIADQLVHAVEQFDFLEKMHAALVSCQSIFGVAVAADEASQQAKAKDERKSVTFVEKIWNAFLISVTHTSVASPMNTGRIHVKEDSHGLLSKYIFELTSDLQSQLYSRVYELARNIYEDLAFSA